MTGLNQTIPNEHGTLVILESTANGTGNWWHEQWQAAEEGDSDFIPLFFPWYKHYEYKRYTNLSIKSELTAEERRMLKLGASFENIEWYRWALYNKADGDLNKLMQEYPTTPEDAFIATGQPIFPKTLSRECFVPIESWTGFLADTDTGKGVRFVQEPSGNLTVFKAPNKDNRSDRYFISGDPSMTVEGDPACMQVINRETYEQVAVWHGRIDPISFGFEMMRVGKYYNMAMLCPEVEGGGQATIATIITHNYPNIWMHRWADKAPGKLSVSHGWATNFQRKSWAIGTLKKRIIDKSILIHDRKTYNQLLDYVVRDDGSWGNSDHATHDDAVMALAIAVTGSETEGPFVPQHSISPIYDIFSDNALV
jgi:hypothetical protein